MLTPDPSCLWILAIWHYFHRSEPFFWQSLVIYLNSYLLYRSFKNMNLSEHFLSSHIDLYWMFPLLYGKHWFYRNLNFKSLYSSWAFFPCFWTDRLCPYFVLTYPSLPCARLASPELPSLAITNSRIWWSLILSCLSLLLHQHILLS